MGCIGGMMRVVVIAATAAAIALNVLVYLSCEFLQVKNNPDITFGLFSIEVAGGGCIKYEIEDDAEDGAGPDYVQGLLSKVIAEDPYIRTAQSSIFAAIAFGSWALLILLFDQYLCPICFAGCLESVGYIGAQIATALVYFLYMSEYCTDGNCAWAQGATYNVIAQGLYLGSSIMAGCMGEKPREARKNKNTKNNDEQPTSSAPGGGGASVMADSHSPSKQQQDAMESGTVASGYPDTPGASAPPQPTYDSPPYATTY